MAWQVSQAQAVGRERAGGPGRPVPAGEARTAALNGPLGPPPGAAVDSSLRYRAAPVRPHPEAPRQPPGGRGVNRAARTGPSSAHAPEKAAIFARPPRLGSRSLPPHGHAAPWPRALPAPSLRLCNSGRGPRPRRRVPTQEMPRPGRRSAAPVPGNRVSTGHRQTLIVTICLEHACVLRTTFPYTEAEEGHTMAQDELRTELCPLLLHSAPTSQRQAGLCCE